MPNIDLFPESSAPRASDYRRGLTFVAVLAVVVVVLAAALIGTRPAAAQSASAQSAPAQSAPAQSAPVRSAAASPQCGAREVVIDRLSAKYDEHPVSIGVTATGSLLEVLASPDGRWTIIVTVPNGPTCLVSSGEGWHNAPVQLVEDSAV